MTVRELLDLVYPRVCAGCGGIGAYVCSKCMADLVPGMRPPLPHLSEIRYCGGYQGWLRDAVIAYKGGDETVVWPLAQVLATVLPTGSRVTPVPSSRKKRQQRGFDTVAGIVECATAGKVELLQMIGDPRDQVGLSAAGRQRNVRSVFRARFLIRGEVWLVDDVITTGATLRAAARALFLAGAGPIRAVALCSAQR